MNSSKSSSLLLPFTFFKYSQAKTPNESQPQLLDPSCSRAQPSVLKSWGPSSSLQGGNVNGGGGVMMGAEDGTLYLFSQHLQSGEIQPPQLSRPTSPPRLSNHSQPPSRSSTPSATSPPPFYINQRARVVSGVTPEQVEAPKNYVDYDDEPDKLKDLLKGRQPRDSKEKLAASPEPGSGRSLNPSNLKRKELPKSLRSVAHSPAFTSYPPSPREPASEYPYDLILWCHIIPPRSGLGHAITRVRLIDDNQCLAVLQETGDLSVFSLQDGSCLDAANGSSVTLQPPNGVEDKDASHMLWLWNHLEVYHIGESTIILASATVSPNSPSSASMDRGDNGALKSRLSIFKFHSNDHLSSLEVGLEKVGQWCYDGASFGVGLHKEWDNTVILFTVTADGHFIVRSLKLLPRVVPQMGIIHQPAEKDIANEIANAVSSIPLPNPFKSLKSHSAEQLPLPQGSAQRGPGRVKLEDVRDLAKILAGDAPVGFRTRSIGGRVIALCWSEDQLAAFEYEMGHLRVLYTDPVVGIQDAEWTTDASYNLLFEDRVESYTLNIVDPNNDTVDTKELPVHWTTIVKSELQHTILIDEYDAVDLSSPTQVLATFLSENGARKLTAFEIAPLDIPPSPRILWQARSSNPVSSRSSRPEITSILPLELDVIVQGHADGLLRQSSLMQLIDEPEKALHSQKVSDSPLNGFVTGLHFAQNSRTRERFIVGGGDDGSVAFWTADQFKLCARWTLFITCLARVVQIQDTQNGPLRGCVLCISVDGTVAVIVVDGFQFLYLIPGSAAPLYRVCFGESNLLLVYANNRARLWDVQTQEFWRSMTLETVEELLEQGGWTDLALDARASVPDIPLKTISGPTHSPDVASTLVLDLDRFTTESITVAKVISTSRDQTRAILLTLERLRSVLSVLLTPGLNADIDSVCTTKLGIGPSRVSTGFVSQSAVTLYRKRNAQDPWCLSGDVSAARALSIAVVLGALGLFEEFMEGANTVMIFYATSLASAVGPGYQPPSLVYLARRWFDGSNDVRRSARVLFDYALACLSDEETNEIAEHWQHQLPCLQPTADRESSHAALALFLCGYLASEKYSLLSTSALTDISKSIALYFHDEQSLHRVLAIDLCSRGFHIWQHYIDALEILRALFSLATSSRKDSINIQNVGQQARLAVLQIASSNTALFMSTLGLDILKPPTLDHRKAVLQVVAFLIRKRPLVLQPNIPKLMEAVVKSLDPNDTTHREAIIDSATEIIGHVVKTFPTVDFQMATQRLAVGSNDSGSVVMYDLKTAIRLYVLECGTKPIAACSFSPDGRRLLTLSLKESVVLVWKVGSSFTSFFNPGAPPRQGHSGSQPFKTISFNVGAAASMNAQDTMDLVRFEWVADRNVKIKIRDSIMTFST